MIAFINENAQIRTLMFICLIRVCSSPFKIFNSKFLIVKHNMLMMWSPAFLRNKAYSGIPNNELIIQNNLPPNVCGTMWPVPRNNEWSRTLYFNRINCTCRIQKWFALLDYIWLIDYDGDWLIMITIGWLCPRMNDFDHYWWVI